jgi:hypothetical protein
MRDAARSEVDDRLREEDEAVPGARHGIGRIGPPGLAVLASPLIGAGVSGRVSVTPERMTSCPSAAPITPL